jgi:ferredoxin-NADP reductase
MYVTPAGNSYPETMLRFLRRQKESDTVLSYYFMPVEPVTYLAGEYGHLRLFGMQDGVRAVREFSFASAPSDPEIMFTVDVGSGSPYQKRLWGLEAGEQVGLFKIKHHMTWPPPEAGEAVMIAGGIGVTPFRSMLRDRHHAHTILTQSREIGLSELKVSLIHVARGEFLFRDELSKLSDEYGMFGREEAATRIRVAAEEKPHAHFYIAGSPGFVETAHKIVLEAGASRVESDSFKGLAEPEPLLDWEN